MAIAYIGLGANLGDRLETLQEALDALAESVSVLDVSSVYETAPQGCADQPDFLNAVARIQTDLPPADLLSAMSGIERRLGRMRHRRWGPRTIDLDILSYDRLVCHGPDLTLPHPRMHQRAFVLIPLAEIAPQFVHPVFGKTASTLAAACAPTQRITRTQSALRMPRVQGRGEESPNACSS
jgi:2-amino-4-hydroxy-6-hydroxymethyldihydropteridine diphosphokinase